MAKVIGIMGESGAGKTTSIRKLDPQTTFYMDCDKKGLNWKGWKSQYSSELGNYARTDNPSTVLQCLEHINMDDKYKHIKVAIIDTINGIMVAEEMRNINKTGYGKWTDLAAYIYGIIDYALVMRDDLTIIFIAHSETISDDNGQVFTRIRTNGRKLDKIVLESKLTTVLWADIVDGQHVFHTQADRSTVKTPLDAFDSATIDNDISIVLKALEEY